jgi:hypothetical protein
MFLWNVANYNMKSSIFWDITPCSPMNFNRRFGGTYRLHLQGRRISRLRSQRGSRWLHGVISQKLVLFIPSVICSLDVRPSFSLKSRFWSLDRRWSLHVEKPIMTDCKTAAGPRQHSNTWFRIFYCLTALGSFRPSTPRGRLISKRKDIIFNK